MGMTLTPMKRFNNLQAAYGDANSIPRLRSSVTGRLLPSARQVALKLNVPDDKFANITVFHVQYGQMLSHDPALSPFPQDATGRNMQCYCNDTNNPLCLVLPTTPDDVINKDQDCMATPRTVSTIYNWQCQNNTVREQINRLTTWLDMTFIYGFNPINSARLRSTQDSGYLATKNISGMSAPVFTSGNSGANQCLRDTVNFPCFQSGEGRTNENLALAGIQVLWHRHHNLVAKLLQNQNGWTGDRLYQETRKIVIALNQHIIYNEWLPIIIGPDMMNQFNLNPASTGYSGVYQSTVSVQVINEFTTAAFRYGHGQVPSQMVKADPDFNIIKSLNLSAITFGPQEAYTDGGLDSFTRGSLISPALLADNRFSDQLQNHLFEVGVLLGNSFRNSLSAFNILRGRDHGFRGYNLYRSSVGLNTATNFQGLTNIKPELISLLQSVYGHVNDIDLFVGGLFENLLPGAQVGQTFGGSFEQKLIFIFFSNNLILKLLWLNSFRI
jgi:peroxidase